MNTSEVKVGNIVIGGKNPIVVQSMCNTHTADIEASFGQCVRLYEAGAEMIRLTVPSLNDVKALAEIKRRLRESGIGVPLVADVHFSPEIAIAAAAVVEKVRINPGNFHKDHEKACEKFRQLVDVCRRNGTAIRIGLNHGSLGERITGLYGNTPEAMKEATACTSSCLRSSSNFPAQASMSTLLKRSIRRLDPFGPVRRHIRSTASFCSLLR